MAALISDTLPRMIGFYLEKELHTNTMQKDYSDVSFIVNCNNSSS